MNTNRSCGCKSFNTCIICETELGLKPGGSQEPVLDNREVWQYCIENGLCINKEGGEKRKDISGIKIIKDFISPEEESSLVSGLDGLPWDSSQSGRRKQNFGPRANFNKRKAKPGAFSGFPTCTKFIQDRFFSVPILEGYKTVEQCSIEYRPETGACIQPHIDDCWIWGERIVQLNLLSSTVLEFNPYIKGEKKKYNRDDVSTYPKVVQDENVVFNPWVENKLSQTPYPFSVDTFSPTRTVRIPLPPRSLLVMWGNSRYEWEHSIKREDITDRRVVIAYRELTPPYLPGGVEEDLGAEILNMADKWW